MTEKLAEGDSMGTIERLTKIAVDEGERKQLLQLKQSIDQTLKRLVLDYHRMEKINRELKRKAGSTAADLERTRSQLRSAHRNLRFFQRREVHLLTFLLKGLKDPLQLIEQHVSRLYSVADSSKARADCLDQLREEVHRLWQIIEDLASVEAVQIGKDEVKREKVNLGEVVRNVVADHRQAARSQHIDLIEDIAAELPMVLGDRERLKLALNHLVDNAISHSPAGATVTIQANGDRLEDRVRLSVMGLREQALGMAARQALPGPTDVQQSIDLSVAGTDIELMAAGQIVAMLNGQIEMMSRPGKETVFMLTLPAESRVDSFR